MRRRKVGATALRFVGADGGATATDMLIYRCGYSPDARMVDITRAYSVIKIKLSKSLILLVEC